MRETRYLVLFGLLLMLCGSAFAQNTLPIQVDLHHSAFAYDENESLLEVYLSFQAGSLPFVADSVGYLARLPIDLILNRSTEVTLEGTPVSPIWQDSLLLNFAVMDTSSLNEGQYFIHQARMTVVPGEYELQIVVPADETFNRSELALKRDVLLPDFSREELVGLSDITLSSRIEPTDDRTSPFYKNGLIIRPNANQLFGQGLNTLYYYAEAYHVDRIADNNSQYAVYVYIAEANRPQAISGLERRSDRDAVSPDVIVGSFDLSSVPSGSYFLRVALLSEDNEAMAEQSQKFFVYNPHVERPEPVAVEMTFETSEYALLSEEEVQRAYEHIVVIAADRDQRRFRGLQDLNEKRRFLMEFWQRRDPRPDTPVNEYKEEYYQRLQYANERYTNNLSDGWKTDRGRALIKYGIPSSIDPHLYDRGMAPHEVWQYNNIPGEGQAIFVFADRNGFGEFSLIHSTVSGELSMPDWERELVN